MSPTPFKQVLLHLRGISRRPANFSWHLAGILRALKQL